MDKKSKSRFALIFGNRAFFPSSLQSAARREMSEVLNKLGHDVLMLDASTTRYGAVETVEDGEKYANFLHQNRGKFDGVILCLPNFGDETGAVAALKDAGVPILVQAYPDELNKMAPEVRRDAFCGKFSIMDVFCQYGMQFTALKPHVVHPKSIRFAENVDYFDQLCRVVKAVRGMVVASIGARTTPFKTVRIDELALQKHGITMETFDLSDIFARMQALKPADKQMKAKLANLEGYASWKGVPKKALTTMARLGVTLDTLIEECKLDAIAVRCWIEMQQQLGISPCVLLGTLNDRGIPAACEVDIGNAVAMHALSKASGRPAACLDWNNNYGDEDDKCILFHCGPVPASLMTTHGQIADHAILANAVGKGCGYGCNTGRIAPTDITFASMRTDDGKVQVYIGQGAFTGEPIPDEFFGCAGVAAIPNLQDALQKIGYMGHRHHVSVTPGHLVGPVSEALERYLGFEVTVL